MINTCQLISLSNGSTAVRPSLCVLSSLLLVLARQFGFVASYVRTQIQLYCPLTSGDQLIAAFNMENGLLWPDIAVMYGYV
jgi:hypothetical protein